MASYPSSPSYIITYLFSITSPMVIPSTLNPTNIKLNRSNFLYWKFQILPIVKAHGLEDFLFGTKLKPYEVIIGPGNSSASLSMAP